MALQYRNLDARTRTLMIEEIERDITAGTLFFSDNLTLQGRTDYPDLIRAAAREGTDASLAEQSPRMLQYHEKTRR